MRELNTILQEDKGIEEQSVLLLKPDGYRSLEVRAYVRSALRAFDLSVAARFAFRATVDDILDIWPKFTSSRFPISLSFVELYMTSGLSEAMIVRGQAAAKRCLEIRNAVRSEFGHGMFSNLVHATSDELERVKAIEKFAVCLPRRVPFYRDFTECTNAGIWGGLSKTPVDILRIVTEKLWVRKEQMGYESLRRELTDDGDYYLYLLTGDKKSVDYGMSAVFNTMPLCDVEEAIRSYLEADVFGHALIKAGDFETVSHYAEELTKLEMRVRVSRAS